VKKRDRDRSHIMKFMLFGDTGVGKTAILDHILGSIARNPFLRPAGPEFTKLIYVDDDRVLLKLWDMKTLHYLLSPPIFWTTRGIILVYDVCQPSSLNYLKKLISEIKPFYLEKYFFLVVANKKDLRKQVRFDFFE